MSILSRANDRKGLLGTILFHVMLFLILLITGFGSVEPIDTDNGGVTVSFGEPDEGGDDSRPAASESESTPPPASSSEESVETTEEEAPEVVTSPVPKPKTETKPNTETKPTEQETKQAAIDPRMKAAIDKFKKSQEAGGGKGDGPKPGEEGRPDGSENGDPDGTGKGTLGNGISYNLKGFQVANMPEIKNEKQSFGIVVVKLCVNRAGQITTNKAGAPGSTTTDSYLYEISERAVRQLTIKPVGSGINDTNCGTITITFSRN
jgi:hypothetical protein